MAILALGVSYRAAPVELLERLAFAPEDLPKAYDHVTRLGSVEGAVFVSTCNRVEIYADIDSYHSGFQELKQFLADSREVAPEEFAEPLYSHYEEQAVEHLFSVASGIDSMVTGEPQILTQVRAAIKESNEESAATPLLESLFRHAVRAGRRARAETTIASTPAAFVEAGLAVARENLGSLQGLNSLVLGAGQMGELAAQALRDAGVAHVKVLNRSVEHAQRLAQKTGGSAGELAHLPEALKDADLVVSSTGASGVLVDAATAAAAIATRSGRPIFFLDLAVPRDVDPEVALIPGATIANVDDLGKIVDAGDQGEIARAREVLSEETARFAVWRRSAVLSPLIAALHDKGERIRTHELERVRAKLEGLSAGEREAVEAATRGIVAKLLHDPVVGARRGQVPAAVLRELFGLAPEGDE